MEHLNNQGTTDSGSVNVVDENSIQQLNKKFNRTKAVAYIAVFATIILLIMWFITKDMSETRQRSYYAAIQERDMLRSERDSIKANSAKEKAAIKAECDKLQIDIETYKNRETQLIQRIAELESQLNPTPEPTPTPKPGEEYNTGLTFKEISRNPENHEGTKVTFSGRVLHVIEGAGVNAVRMSTKGDYDDVIYATYSTSIIDFRLLEDDNITIYGTFVGMKTYTTVMGSSLTLPEIRIDRIVLNGD